MARADRASANAPHFRSEIVAALLAHRLLIVFGKGGVGKTTVSAALALRAAERGARAVAAEVDGRGSLAALFGRGPSLDPAEAAHRLSVIVLDGRRALEEYLRLTLPFGSLVETVFSATLYENFVSAAPGLRELMMLGKVYYETRVGGAGERWETTVLDAASSGQALGLLRMPSSARHTFAGGVVGREAQNISRFLQDSSDTTAALVSTPDHLSIKETLDNAEALKELCIKVGAVILNRFRPARFNIGDLRQLIARASHGRKPRSTEHLCTLALAEIKRAAQSSQALAALTRQVRAPVLVVQASERLDGLPLVKHLCAGFGGEVSQPQAPATGHDEPGLTGAPRSSIKTHAL